MDRSSIEQRQPTHSTASSVSLRLANLAEFYVSISARRPMATTSAMADNLPSDTLCFFSESLLIGEYNRMYSSKVESPSYKFVKLRIDYNLLIINNYVCLEV